MDGPILHYGLLCFVVCVWDTLYGSPVQTGLRTLHGWVYLFHVRFSFPFRCGVTSLGLFEVSDFASWIPLRRLCFGLQVRLVKRISLPSRMSASIYYAAILLWKG